MVFLELSEKFSCSSFHEGLRNSVLADAGWLKVAFSMSYLNTHYYAIIIIICAQFFGIYWLIHCLAIRAYVVLFCICPCSHVFSVSCIDGSLFVVLYLSPPDFQADSYCFLQFLKLSSFVHCAPMQCLVGECCGVIGLFFKIRRFGWKQCFYLDLNWFFALSYQIGDNRSRPTVHCASWRRA